MMYLITLVPLTAAAIEDVTISQNGGWCRLHLLTGSLYCNREFSTKQTKCKNSHLDYKCDEIKSLLKQNRLDMKIREGACWRGEDRTEEKRFFKANEEITWHHIECPKETSEVADDGMIHAYCSKDEEQNVYCKNELLDETNTLCADEESRLRENMCPWVRWVLSHPGHQDNVCTIEGKGHPETHNWLRNWHPKTWFHVACSEEKRVKIEKEMNPNEAEKETDSEALQKHARFNLLNRAAWCRFADLTDITNSALYCNRELSEDKTKCYRHSWMSANCVGVDAALTGQPSRCTKTEQRQVGDHTWFHVECKHTEALLVPSEWGFYWEE